MYGKEISERIAELKYKVKTLANDVGIDYKDMFSIKYDRVNLIDRDVFLNLMKCLNLNPIDFGGFVKLDFKNPNDFYDGFLFINNINKKLRNDPYIKAKDLADYLGISESALSLILSFKQTSIHIDRYYLLCKYFNLNYHDYLVDKNIYPSLILYNENLEFNEESKLNELIEIANSLDGYEMNKLLSYARKLRK